MNTMMKSLKNTIEECDAITITKVVIDEESDYSTWHQLPLAEFLDQLLDGKWDLKNVDAHLTGYSYNVPTHTAPTLTINVYMRPSKSTNIDANFIQYFSDLNDIMINKWKKINFFVNLNDTIINKGRRL